MWLPNRRPNQQNTIALNKMHKMAIFLWNLNDIVSLNYSFRYTLLWLLMEWYEFSHTIISGCYLTKILMWKKNSNELTSIRIELFGPISRILVYGQITPLSKKKRKGALLHHIFRKNSCKVEWNQTQIKDIDVNTEDNNNTGALTTLPW